MMYNVVVWSGFQAREMRDTPQGSVVVLQGSKRGFWPHFQSLSCCSAKSQDHQSILRGFSFGADRQGALAKRPAWAAPKKHRQCVHPASVRPALIERLVKDWVQRWNQGPIYKRINPSWALGSSGHRPQDRSGVGHIHPWRCYV
jgi:hypothetical protein